MSNITHDHYTPKPFISEQARENIGMFMILGGFMTFGGAIATAVFGALAALPVLSIPLIAIGGSVVLCTPLVLLVTELVLLSMAFVLAGLEL